MAFNPCCCLTLRTGGFLIGILEIISWSIALRDTIVGITLIQSISSFVQAFGYNQNTTELERITADQAIETWYIISGLTIGVCVIRILIACLLLLGIQRNSVRMITIWMCVKVVTLFIGIGSFIASICFKSKPNDSSSNDFQPWQPFNYTNSTTDGVDGADDPFDYYFGGGQGQAQRNSTNPNFGIQLFYTINIGVSFYFLAVVYHLLKELKSKRSPNKHGKVIKA